MRLRILRHTVLAGKLRAHQNWPEDLLRGAIAYFGLKQSDLGLTAEASDIYRGKRGQIQAWDLRFFRLFGRYLRICGKVIRILLTVNLSLRRTLGTFDAPF